MDLVGLIEALSRPEAWRERRVDVAARRLPIEVRQTHISVVFLVGDEAWKVKKPVDLGFLDFSTLERRRRFCVEEVRLNRRTAPEVYLGVDSIVRDRDGSLVVTGSPGGREIVDVAVRMRRLPDDGWLDARLDRLAETPRSEALGSMRRLLGDFAPRLAAFHAAGATGRGIDEHGGPEGMRRQFEANFERLASFAGEDSDAAISPRRLDWLRRGGTRRLEADRGILEARVRASRVRDGHGDLHAGNLCVVDGGILAFDAIEFDHRLRCRDVACEVAHLAMDLDRRGLAALAEVWTRAYARSTNDPGVVAVARVFRLHYAVVRALVEAIRSRDAAVGHDGRSTSLSLARRDADLATGYLLPPSLVLTCGLQGAGKSTFARAISIPLRAHQLRSDVLRKRLAGIAVEDRRRIDREGRSLYDERWTDATYARMLRAAQAALGRGRHVVVDAAFSKESQRGTFIDLATRLGVPWVLVEATCDREEVRRRLEARATDRHEPSDADWSVFERAERSFERPTEVPPGHRLEWRSETPADEGVRAAIDRLIGKA